MKKVIVSPSLLSSDLLNLQDQVRQLEKSGADWLHIDVMDGHFVPNLTFGLPILEALKKITRLPLDVHIMVQNPDLTADSYLSAGADILSFHIEAANHPFRIIQNIKARNAKAGIALNPGTPVSLLEPMLHDLDMVTLLAVNPGFSGQKFMPVVYDKLRILKDWCERNKRSDLIVAVDGGVSTSNVKALIELGANCFVSGSFIFRSTHMKEAIASLR